MSYDPTEYVKPTCSNSDLLEDEYVEVDYDDQVFAFYTFRGKRMIMQGWLCEDENCPLTSHGIHLVSHKEAGTLFLDWKPIENAVIYTTEELIKIVEE